MPKPARTQFEPMRRLSMRLVSWLLFFAAASAAAQAPTARWTEWQPAMAPDGSAHAAIQFRWRSDRPCAEVGCQLSVQIRNISHAPVKLRCLVYFDPPPAPYEDEVRPVIVDTLLKAFGGSRTGTPKAGDTTNPLIITGISITGVVVEWTKPK